MSLQGLLERGRQKGQVRVRKGDVMMEAGNQRAGSAMRGICAPVRTARREHRGSYWAALTVLGGWQVRGSMQMELAGS